MSNDSVYEFKKNSQLFFSYLEGEDSDDEGRETDERVQAGMCCFDQ